MHEPFYLGAYWGARRETVEECAERLADCLESMKRCSSLMGAWATKPGRGVHPVTVCGADDVGALRDLLRAGTNQRDADGSAIAELGFSLALWNGNREMPIGLSVTCGAWTTAPGVMNSFVIDLPTPAAGAELYDIETALALMRATVAAWQPDWATLTSYELADALDAPPRVPTLGWITFLGDPRPVPARALSGRSEKVPGGALLVSADQVQQADATKMMRLRDELQSAGSLTPIP
jgi:hypothetical protein